MEIHAVEDHGNAAKAVKLRHRPLNLRAERHRHGPAPVVVKPVENGLSSPLRLHLRHVVNRVDAGNAPRQSCRQHCVQNHVQVGVNHVRSFLPENLRKLRHHGHIQSRLFAQVPDTDARRLHAVGNLRPLIKQTHHDYVVSQVPQGISQIFTHSFRPAKAEIGDDLQ